MSKTAPATAAVTPPREQIPGVASLKLDPERLARMWAMTPAQRLQAAQTGRLTLGVPVATARRGRGPRRSRLRGAGLPPPLAAGPALSAIQKGLVARGRFARHESGVVAPARCRGSASSTATAYASSGSDVSTNSWC